MKNLKITYIGQSIADGTGVGGSARLKNMIKIFKDIGMKLDIISFSFYSEKLGVDHRVLDESTQLTLINIPKKLPRNLKVSAIIPVVFYGYKSCKSSDIVFSDFITEIAYIPGIILGKLFRLPIILDCIDTRFFKIIPDRFKGFAARQSDLIFAISYYLFNYCENKYRCKNIIYMPIFIDCDLFKLDHNDRACIRQKYCIQEDEIVIGYAGAFHPWEGIPILLRAFKNIKSKFPNVKLAVMGKMYSSGDDNISDLINKLEIADETIFIPSQPYESVPRYLSAFDILCCPKTDCEINRAANPVKVVEYMSMGLPCVCSAVGGIIDTIEDGVDGLLVIPDNVQDLEEKLKWVILNAEKAKAMGLNGRKKVMENNSCNALEETMKNAFIKIIK